MELLQIREKEIFDALKKINNQKFAVIGGYAVNAYTLPRFSVDCDIVTENKAETAEIAKELDKLGYEIAKGTDFGPYSGDFLRYEKAIKKNFIVSFDILIKNVYDRQTKAMFSAEWVFKNSALRALKGKTIAGELKLRIVNPEALVVMKLVACRNTDIRDIFMLMPQVKDPEWVKGEVSERADFNDRFLKIKEKIVSEQFKDNLQGVYGHIDNKLFEKHKKAVLDYEKFKNK
ncbi:nucleotidyl transferase AbiEii/AbiGii toxin family protein [Candidatus Woesearchaeota archaeon]|nr:nucleotidyl transferase AbiEii/AbiGii toxin family protein [Candidatus Woesearchaeota archaeon]